MLKFKLATAQLIDQHFLTTTLIIYQQFSKTRQNSVKLGKNCQNVFFQEIKTKVNKFWLKKRLFDDGARFI